MHRRFITVFLGMMTLAAMSVAPNAGATLKEPKPRNQIIIENPKATCTVGLNSTVVINPGVSPTVPNKNFYLFIGGRISCVWASLKGLKTYNVTAQGCTSGAGVPGVGGNGETSALGWSASGWLLLCTKPSGARYRYVTGTWDLLKPEMCGNKVAGSVTNKGNILVREVGGGQSALGWVKFTRVGTVVKAWGKLQWRLLLKKQLCFTADLQFTPLGALNPTRRALLNGTAIVGNGAVDDPKNRV